MVKKKRLLIIISVIVLVSLILLWYNWKRLKVIHFIFSEKEQLNEIVSLVRQKPDDKIDEIDLYIGEDEDYYSYWSERVGHITCESKEMERVLSILKDFKKKYGKYELDFNSISVLYQGDKIWIRITLSAKPDEIYEDKYSVYKLVYIDDGYDLKDHYDDVKFHKVGNGWRYYSYYGDMG